MYRQRGHEGTAAPTGPRGPGRQEQRRLLERLVREGAVELSTQLRAQGCLAATVAGLLHLAGRTLRHWCQRLRHLPVTLRLLGRPSQRAPLPVRQELLEVLDELGPGVGVPTLRAHFPEMGRRELEDFVRRYRRVWRWHHRQAVHVLRWTEPGRVWAMDFTEVPGAIDGSYSYLLAVRDLASGQQLLALPTRDVQEATVRPALASLFREYGAPLVLKVDNGSAFRAGVAQDYLRAWGITCLFSPPRQPRYNGAIEAGIGSLKTRIEVHATRLGRPGVWTWDDVEAARSEANATARPRGLSEPTPDEAWAARAPVSDVERGNFQARVACYRADELARVTGADPATVTGADWDLLWTQKEQAGEDRRAVRRALEASGYLWYPRRRIKLPIPGKKTARDS
jgi:transposase InsO family protein